MKEKPAKISFRGEVDNQEITEFSGLTKEEQAQIENEIIMFITNPAVIYITHGVSENSPVLELTNGDDWIQLNSHGRRNIIFRKPDDSKEYQMIAFDKLPRKIELLLGIIHRGFFEKYKKVIVGKQGSTDKE